MSKKNRKKKKAGIWSTIIIIVAVVIIVFSLSKLIPILSDYKQADQTYDQLKNEYITESEFDDTDEEWWAEAVQIDFENLKQINPDVIGWIRFDNVEEIPIDYPIMYSGDNDTYLRTDLYGEEHTAGSIFLEAANVPDFSGYHNIIYGHNMKNGSMFGTLKQYKRDEGLYDTNSFFTIYTEDAAYRYQIFSYEDVSENSEIYTVGYAPDESYQKLIDRMVSGSIRDTGITPDKEEKIVTLSTCSTSGDHYRFVVHALCVDEKIYSDR